MTSSPVPEPEFRGKTLTPVSPCPVHISDPASIPVLEKQIDQVFNDTSTHLPPTQNLQTMPNMAATSTNANICEVSAEDSSSLSSAYDDEDEMKTEVEGNEVQANGDGPVNDDYAMSLDFDDESDMQEKGEDDEPSAATNGLTEHQAIDAPPQDQSVAIPLPNPLPLGAGPASNPVGVGESIVPTKSTNASPTLASSTASSLTVGEGSPATTVPRGFTTSADGNVSIQANLDPQTDVVAGGEVNLQALLDNLSHPTATPTTAPPLAGLPTATTTAFQPGPTDVSFPPTASLPALHATLPPRPPPQEKPASHPGYSPQDDIRSYHPHIPHAPTKSSLQSPAHLSSQSNPPANPTTPNPQSISTYRPPTHGLPPPLIGAGAPGTASLPGTGLPPPPVATFQQTSAPGTTAQPPPTGLPRNPLVEERAERNLSQSVNSGDDEDERPWGPEVQKSYDAFLQEERVFVTEGQWDRFPPNSRLFIGEPERQLTVIRPVDRGLTYRCQAIYQRKR